MALGQVGARIAGDVYQGLFFWRQAANLLRPGTGWARVDIEHDKASGVDDVAVFYEAPFVRAGLTTYTADFYQVKYHVDNSNSYCSEGLIDPTFISKKSRTSLLQKFFKAYEDLVPDHSSFRLHLISNWRWKEDDPLAPHLRECDDGSLPEKFFTDPETRGLGKIRKRWSDHLTGKDQHTLLAFFRSLRFGLSQLGRRSYKEYVDMTLMLAGLKVSGADHSSCPYDSLTQQILMSKKNSYNRVNFAEFVKTEGLLDETRHLRNPALPSIGIRSFLRCAENLEADVQDFVCCVDHFSGRHPRDVGSWELSAHQLVNFLSQADRITKLRKDAHSVHLECHGSLALLAGYALSRNSGAQVFPLQKPTLDLWRPSSAQPSSEQWAVRQIDLGGSADEIAIGLAVTHDLEKDILSYLKNTGSAVAKLAILSPPAGIGPTTIAGGDHAFALASSFLTVLSQFKPNRTTRVHLFPACPVALLYFIGQLRDGLGRLTLYEFDFGMETDCSYKPSFSLPLP